MGYIIVVFTIAAFVLLSFGLNYGLFKLINKQKRPVTRWGFWVSVVLTTPVIYFLVVFALFAILSYSPSRDFSKEAWLNEPNKRVELINDLLKNYEIKGKTREEIIALLGDPLEKSPYFQESGRDMIYLLGPERGTIFGLDSEWLLLWLDNGLVTKYSLARD